MGGSGVQTPSPLWLWHPLCPWDRPCIIVWVLSESGVPWTYRCAVGWNSVVRPPPPARGGGLLRSVVWLSAHEEKETEFGKPMVVSVTGCEAAQFIGCEDPVEASPLTNICVSRAGSYKEIVISFTQKRGLPSNELGSHQVKGKKNFFLLQDLSESLLYCYFPDFLGSSFERPVRTNNLQNVVQKTLL